MGKKTSSSTSVNKTTATASSKTPGSKSSILKSSFAPSSLQLHLFASVIQSFDAQQLRIHDTATGRLRQQHTTLSGTDITSLDWGHYGPAYRESQISSKKKRKRTQGANEDVVVAYGTSSSDIHMFSPAEGRIVGHLQGGHERGIKDFKFNPDNNLEAWSVGGDGKLVQWDLRRDRAVRTISLPETSVGILARPSSNMPQILCASNVPCSIDVSTSDESRISTYSALRHPVHSLVRSGVYSSGTPELFLAADSDRFINVFDFEHQKIVRTLVTASEVESLSFYSPLPEDKSFSQEQLLAVVTRDGIVELFTRPFASEPIVNGDLKTKRKTMSAKATSQVHLVQHASTSPAAVFAAHLQGPDLILVSVDGGIEPSFQKMRWQDEGTGELLFSGVKEVTKTKSASAFNTATMNGVKDMGKQQVDESRTVVLNGALESLRPEAAIEISDSDEEANDEGDATDSDSAEEQLAIEENGSEDDSDAEMEDQGTMVKADESAKDVEMADVGGQEPTFGDLLAARHPSTITIADAFNTEVASRDQASAMQMALPSGMSLGAVLTQALRTNDNNLLESCLHASEKGIVQNTLQRLDSGLAAVLLTKLADRLASRPGRYGHLLSWVQWTCIAHGGAIASMPDVAARLRRLYQVLGQRGKSLDKLLLLKGKLDMLEAQMSFRKELQAQRSSRNDENEPGIIYVEGQEDNWSSEDDLDEAAGVPKKLGFKTRRPLAKGLSEFDEQSSSDDDDEEDMPTTNGVAPEDSDNEEESDSEIDANGSRKTGIVDIEAEVSGEDDLSDEEDDDGDDVGDSEDEEDEEEEDSSMDDFINDGSISEVSEEDDIDIDEDAPKRPSTKRSKHR